jgi:hypothetical protein
MAYMSFAPWTAEQAEGNRPAGATADDAALFSSLELRVINLGARSDVSREMTGASRIGRFLESTLGLKLDRPLASPRLERLRRYASMIRHHPDQLDETDLGALIEAGFSQRQVNGLRQHLTGHGRGARRSAGV